VEGGLLLDVVVAESPAVLELLAGEDEPLLIRRNALLVLDLGLDVLNGVAGLNVEGDGLACKGLDEDLHTSPEPEHKVEGGLLLDVVVAESPAVLELLAGEDEPLLIGRNALLVLDLGLDVLNGVAGLNVEGDGLACKGLDEDLHTSPEPEHKVEGGLLLDVVVAESPAVLELLAGEDEPLLIGRNALLVLDLGLDVLNGVAGLNVEGDGLACKGLDEDLHTSPEPEHKVEGGLLLDVVVAESPAVLELLAGEDKPLLIGRNAFLVLNLSLDVLNGVAGLNVEGDGLACKGLDEDLHTSPEPEHKVEGGLLLDVVVAESSAVLELLAGEDEPLLIRGDALLVLDLGLDVLNGVAGLNVEGDGLACKGLDEDLHTSAEPEHKVEGGLLLDVVVAESSAVLELLAGEDEPLLIRGDALLVLDLGLDVLNGVAGLNVEGDGLACKGLDEDLHTSAEPEHKVEGGLLLDVVVAESSAVLELLAGEDEPLLIRGDALLVLDLGLDVLNGVAGLNVEGDGLACKGLDENLHLFFLFFYDYRLTVQKPLFKSFLIYSDRLIKNTGNYQNWKSSKI
jgi:hypothetical protein